MTEEEKENQVNISVRNSESIGLTLNNIVSEIAGGVSSSDFQQILTHLKDKPSIARTLYNMQTADIIEENRQNIDKMYNETGIGAKYNEITQLINNTNTDKNIKAWRPTTGDCNKQLDAYRKKILLEKKTKLEVMLQEERNKRELLKKSLDHKRSHVETLLKNIKAAKAKLERNSEYTEE